METGVFKSCLFKLFAAYILFIVFGCDEYSIGPNDNFNNASFIAKESFSFSAVALNNSKFRLEAINGNVTITGNSTSDSIIIKGEKIVASESISDAQTHLTQLNVDTQNITNGILIKTKQPNESNGRSYTINYIISIPNNYEISVELANGNVLISSINNAVSVNNINGEVSLDDIFGSTFINLVNGQIKSKQSLPQNGIINFASVNGSIKLDIPSNTSAEFSAGTINGNISVSNLIIKNQVVTATSIKGILNAGEGKINLSLVNGSISAAGL